jgi:hypothetical protein
MPRLNAAVRVVIQKTSSIPAMRFAVLAARESVGKMVIQWTGAVAPAAEIEATSRQSGAIDGNAEQSDSKNMSTVHALGAANAEIDVPGRSDASRDAR